MSLPRNPRPLLITFHCGIFFLYYAVFMMSISNREVEPHFEQMGPDFIRNMLIILSVNFVGYLALWNLRRTGVVILGIAGAVLCAYGFMVGQPILLNYLPLVAALTTAPMWPVLKTP
jgi:hypothetical protein